MLPDSGVVIFMWKFEDNISFVYFSRIKGVVIFMWEFEENISFVYFSRIKVELRHT
jgi:hypothetical protein